MPETSSLPNPMADITNLVGGILSYKTTKEFGTDGYNQRLAAEATAAQSAASMKTVALIAAVTVVGVVLAILLFNRKKQ